MPHIYSVKLADVKNDGLAVLVFEGDAALWSRAKSRKHHVCAATGDRIKPGDMAWRPIGNQMYRMQRVSDTVMQLAIEGYRIEQEREAAESQRQATAALPWCER